MPTLGTLVHEKAKSARRRYGLGSKNGYASPLSRRGGGNSSGGSSKNSHWMRIDGARVEIRGGVNSQNDGENQDSIPLKGIRVDQSFGQEEQ